MTWSPGGKPSYTEPRKSWSPSGPVAKSLDSKVGWWRVPTFDGLEIFQALDYSIVEPNTAGFEYQAARDLAESSPLVSGIENYIVRESGLAIPASSGLEVSNSGDVGTLGFTIPEPNISSDFGLSVPATSGPSTGAASDMGTRSGQAAFGVEAGITTDSGTGWFVPPADAPWLATFSTVGSFTFTFPVWCRWVDIVLLGGGASGQTGSGATTAAGKGGNAGGWYSATLYRGSDFPWTTISMTITVGAGGARAADSDLAASNPGSATTCVVNGVTYTGAGGSGNTANQTGGTPSPQTTSFHGASYTAGSGGTGNAGAPTAPGGGGAGGNGGIFGNRTRGAAGAIGRAWVRAGVA